MGPPAAGSVAFRVLVDGAPPGEAHGLEVDEEGNGTLDRPRLYQLIREPGSIADRTFEITFGAPGAEVYCFTSGKRPADPRRSYTIAQVSAPATTCSSVSGAGAGDVREAARRSCQTRRQHVDTKRHIRNDTSDASRRILDVGFGPICR
jgi:hypothetical protein